MNVLEEKNNDLPILIFQTRSTRTLNLLLHTLIRASSSLLQNSTIFLFIPEELYVSDGRELCVG